ncbi:MAG: helix-turn-helix domain-containing protein [Lachnospiraceae bacterium]
MNLERTSLSRQFHREIGRTLTEYIHGAKMEEAEKLIVSHQYSLVAIANMLGYSSYRYFAKVYKKYRHCPPQRRCALLTIPFIRTNKEPPSDSFFCHILSVGGQGATRPSDATTCRLQPLPPSGSAEIPHSKG